MGAVGFMGSLACLLVLENLTPQPSALASYALFRSAMAAIATWVYLPSFLLTLVPGLLAIAATPAFLNARWVWIKAATGILIFAGGLHVLAPIQDEARVSAEVMAGQQSATALAGTSPGEAGTMWLLLIVSTANVVLGIWRRRITR
jgi:hypothetical protein